jgi:phosphoribosyl 1,2-cyclic phosphodiesterase
LAVELWGVRGSTATPEAGNLRYGGNTTCISIRSAAGDRIIVDAGTGIRRLGRHLPDESSSTPEINLFLTHFHWDHIQGLPFFAPLIQSNSRVCFHAGVAADETRLRLERQMSSPFFTLPFDAVAGRCGFAQMTDAPLRCGKLAVQAFPLNHPQGAWGYRVEADGAVVVIATDLEHGHTTLDKVLREHSAGADLLIYDAQYTEAEYSARVGWGHSTPHEAAAVAAAAGVKQLLLFHHDPNHDDQKMDEIVAETRTWFAATGAAQEGETIKL